MRGCGRATTAALTVAAGLPAAWAVQHADTGSWSGFALVQSGYRYGLRSPLSALVERVGPLFRAPFEGAAEAPAAQTLLVLALVLSAATGAVLAARRGVFSPRDRFAAFYLAAAWLLPLVIGEVEGGLHRREATLLPLVLLTAHLPRPWQWLLLIPAAAVAYALALVFLRSQLV